ncbi:MAG: AAA family ATPase [Chloroflexi bacterium]|nr:AAA family ATPase [Chloroflexota bacterium]
MTQRRVLFLLGLCLLFSLTPTAFANGGVVWSSTGGPAGGQINALAIATGVAYAGTNGGAFVTRDDGARWDPASKGLAEDLTVNSLVVLREPTQVLAGTQTGVYRTNDGGATWTLTDPRIAEQIIFTLASDPVTGMLYAGTATTVLRSDNNGDAWSEVNRDLPAARVSGIAILAEGVFAATDAGIYVSRDRGAHWLASADGLPVGARPQSIAATKSGLLVGTTQGLFRSRDGKSWSAVTGTLANGLVKPLASDPRQPDRVFAVIAQTVWRSTDAGANWSQVKSIPGDAPVLTLAFGDKNAVYAGTVRGVWKTADDNASWQALNTGLVNTSIHALMLAPGNPPTLFAATRFGLHISRDRGASWRDAQGLSDPYVISLARDPADDQTIYAGTWGSAVFVSRDGGATFARVIESIAPNTPISSLAFASSGTTTELYAGTQGRGLFKSTDKGQTWARQTNGIGDVSRVTALVFVSPATLYAGTERGLFRLDMAKPGAAWQALTGTDLPQDEVRTLAADAQSLYIGFASAGVYRGDNAGAQWQALGRGAFPARARFQVIALNPGSPGVVYVGTDRGLYRSEDAGATWAAANEGLVVADVLSIAVDPQTATSLFVGTNGSGVVAGVDRLKVVGPDVFAIGALIGALVSAIVVLFAGAFAWRTRLSPVAQDQSWRREYSQWESAITQALWKNGEANAANLSKLPRRYLSRSLRRYAEEHPRDALDLQLAPASLKLETFAAAQKFLRHWKAAWEVVESEDAFLSVTSQIVDQLCELLGFARVEDRTYHGLAGYVVKAPALRLKIPPRFPIIFVPRQDTSPSDLNELRDMMNILNMVSYFALVIDLRDVPADDSRRSLKRIVREGAHDFIVLDGMDIRRLLGARDPSRRLVELILDQVDLTVVSPYVTSGPVPENMFFGREHELKTIVRTVRDTNFAIVGGRKIGKTSVLARVHHMLKNSPEYRPLYLDCQAVHNHTEFFSAVDTMWQLPLPSRDLEGFRAMARDVAAQYPQRVIVMLFDEIDDLLAHDIANGERLFQILRALSQEAKTRFVFCGEKTLNLALHNPNLVFFNFCNLMPLSYLARDEARRVITDPMQDMGVALDDEHTLPDRIVELAAGHPNIVQYICQKLVERINARRERVITRVDVSALAQSAQFAEYFAEVSWGAASSLERLITLVMLEHPEVTPGEMAEMLRARDLRVPPAQLEMAFDDLCLFSILRRDGPKYAFAARAFPEVLRRSQDIYGLVMSYTEEIQKGTEAIHVN